MLHKRSIAIKGHRTSIALEEAFWRKLELIAEQRHVSLPALIATIDKQRLTEEPSPGLASALRVFVLNELDRDQSSIDGQGTDRPAEDQLTI